MAGSIVQSVGKNPPTRLASESGTDAPLFGRFQPAPNHAASLAADVAVMPTVSLEMALQTEAAIDLQPILTIS